MFVYPCLFHAQSESVVETSSSLLNLSNSETNVIKTDRIELPQLYKEDPNCCILKFSLKNTVEVTVGVAGTLWARSEVLGVDR